MKEYEIVIKIYNACAGSGRPQTYFEEAELENIEDYIRMKHGKDFNKFQKEFPSDEQIIYRYNSDSVSYVYEFTEI